MPPTFAFVSPLLLSGVFSDLANMKILNRFESLSPRILSFGFWWKKKWLSCDHLPGSALMPYTAGKLPMPF